MMNFMKKHWQSMVITVIAIVILYIEARGVNPYKRFIPFTMENSFFGATATWGLRFLLLSLVMSPLYDFSGWRFPLKLRKPLGLTAFLFVSIHVGIHLFSKWNVIADMNLIERLMFQPYLRYGAVAFVILAMMAITSIKATMKLMGRFWKPLHRLVYVAGGLIMVHSMMAISMSKRSQSSAEEALAELKIYLAILVVLLILRIPVIKHSLQRLIPFAPGRRKQKAKRSVLVS